MPTPDATSLTTPCPWPEPFDLAKLQALLDEAPSHKLLGDVLAWRRVLGTINARLGIATTEQELLQACVALARDGGPEEHPHLRVTPGGHP